MSDGAKSIKTCRHAPQGGQNSPELAVITTDSNSRSPSLNALNNATRSAHIVKEYDETSML